ncbi:beta-ketoacyl-[acyl-carrier-protein] synthase family protein [Streptomyces sp. NPDC056144]|uniref:beta-ketoacyl-[acyl-carrier-protein] synthase family protein n=1 Tax=unclassified Streptomyces TaxID=2593676 RepID=UPI0035D55E2C
MSLPVAVTGLGLVTPAGIGVEESWRVIREGRGTQAAEVPELKTATTRTACRVPGFDGAELLGMRRAHRLDLFSQFALVAVREALADAGLDPESWDGTRVAVVMGNSTGGLASLSDAHEAFAQDGPRAVPPLLLPLYLPNMAAGQVAIEFHALGPCLAVSTACASGATALGTARDLLLAGRCDIAIAGGTEAPLTPLCVSGFANLGALASAPDPSTSSRPFDVTRDGFVIAEGAGVVVLEREADARARGGRVRALLAGYGASADAHHPTSPHPEGRGLALALRGALADAGLSGSDIDHVNAHGTGTPRGDAAEAAVLREVVGQPVVTSVKGVTGHALAAAGAIEAVCTVLSVETGEVPPTANLTELDPRMDIDVPRTVVRRPVRAAISTSIGFGGQNAALVMTSA